MKRALIVAAALTLAATSAASAQDHHNEHGDGHPAAPAHQGGPPVGGHPQGAPQGGGFHGGPGGAAVQRPTYNQVAPGYQGQHGGGFNSGDQRGQGYNSGYGAQHGGYNGGSGGYGRGGYAGGYGGQHGGGAFSYHGRTFQAFHAGAFRYPGGYGYRRWGIGQRLPLLFLSPAYFINWGAYSLGPPAPGCEWVRYGPDALMVNDYTGQVVDVAYGVFY